MTKCVYLIATMDTKGEELAFVRDCLVRSGVVVRTVDVGTKNRPTVAPDITRDEILAAVPVPTPVSDRNTPPHSDRGEAIASMANALTNFLIGEVAAGKVAGLIGLGGSGGTSLITTAMRSMPIGLPKIMVSTVASGNVAPYVDCSDILMMFSVVDVAGINAVSHVVLSNAAHAMAGMVQNVVPARTSKPTLGLTMFGVTTTCVNRVRLILEEKGFDCLVFHAVGSGGRAMELLVASGLISGVLDITTTEVADEIAGGIFSCGPNRFDKLLAAGIPVVVSLGALDMVNFGAMETVPTKYHGRLLHQHNAQVTLMRTNVDENVRIAEFIATKLNQSRARLRVLVPDHGFSSLDLEGQMFYDPIADNALIDELQRRLQIDGDRQIERLSLHINSPEFADALVQNFLELWEGRSVSNHIGS